MANQEKKQNSLFYLALILLVFSVIIFSVNVIKVLKITGRATGTANLTIEGKTQINFTIDNIDWGSGCVDAGKPNATLNTAAGAGNAVINGNWTENTDGFRIENIGNQNVTLDLKTGKNAQQLLGGTDPDYEYNVTNYEANSCTPPAGFNLGTFYDVNTTNPGTRICDVFQFSDSNDVIRIDVKLVIPSDSKTGAIGDTFTVTATTI